MDVAILLYEGFDDLDAVGPYEVLRNAQEAGMPIVVRLLTLAQAEVITSSHGLQVVPHGVVEGTPDLVIVPGGAWAARRPVGAWGEIERGDLPKALATLREDGAAMASVCTGAMLLSAAGITTGRPAITHHVAIEALRDQGAEVIEARVVDDGDLVTAGGVTAGIDMALWLVERHFGRDLADKIARGMEHDRRGEVHVASDRR